MKLISQFFYIIVIILIFALSVMIIPNIDWQNEFLMPIILLMFLAILFFSIIDIKKSFLAIIIFLPTIIYFNDYKLNISKIFTFLSNYNLPINLTALISLFLIFLGITTILSCWNKIRKLPLRYIILIYIIYILISIFWSNDLEASLIGIVYFLVPFFAYIITYCHFNKKEDVFSLSWAAIISSTIPIIIGFSQMIAGQLYYEPDSSLGRITSTFVHPNLYGLYLFVIFAILTSFYFAKKNQKILNNKIIIIFLLFILLSLLFSYSRVAWVATFLFIILITVIKKELIIFFSSAIPIITLIAFSIEKIKFRILKTFSNARYSSWSTRKRIWKVAWEEIIKKPILGNGVGTSEKVIEKAKNWRGGTSLPHNDFILYWLEMGIIGLFLFLAYTLGAIYYIFKKFQELTDEYINIKIMGYNLEINYKKFVFGILAILLAMLLASFFESTSKRIVVQIIIWSLLGSIFSLEIKKQTT